LQDLPELLPMEKHRIVVRVHGNGLAIKANLLAAAQAIADDRIKRVGVALAGFGILTTGSTIHYDLKRRVVTVTRLFHHVPGLLESAFAFGPAAVVAGGIVAPGIYPAFPTQDNVGDNGEYICFPQTFNQPNTNAPPPGDLRSRGTFLENVVAQALTDPCELQPAPVSPPWMASGLKTDLPRIVGNQPPLFQPASTSP